MDQQSHALPMAVRANALAQQRTIAFYLRTPPSPMATALRLHGASGRDSAVDVPQDTPPGFLNSGAESPARPSPKSTTKTQLLAPYSTNQDKRHTAFIQRLQPGPFALATILTRRAPNDPVAEILKFPEPPDEPD